MKELRKDLMLEKYKVYEESRWGEDWIIIIMERVDEDIEKEMEEKDLEMGMDEMIEVNEEDEMEREMKI